MLKRLKLSGNLTILVFLLRAPISNFKGNPVSGGAKHKADWKILRFSTVITVYLGNGTR